jgi:hypothetical protein
MNESDSFLDQDGPELAESPPAKKIRTAATNAELELYSGRAKRRNPADAFRKKRALVFLLTWLFHNPY